jgi:ankyrin repeat protein
VRLLLDRGARASFFEACALGLVTDVRQQLAANPALVGAWAHDGWPPLHLAAFFGQRETAEILLDAGADVRAVSRNSEGNLAINAAAAGQRADRRPEIVKLLIARGTPVDGRGHRRRIRRCTKLRSTAIWHSYACCSRVARIGRSGPATARPRSTSR